MRETHKKKVMKEITETTEDLYCDLCHKHTDKTSWKDRGCYEMNKTDVTVTVKQKEGYSCSDGGSGTEIIIDLCPNCFKNKLVPWLISQGATIKEQDWN